MNEIVLDFGDGMNFAIDEETRRVSTRFGDGLATTSVSNLDVETLNAAIDLGYHGTDPAFDALIERDAFRTLAAKAALRLPASAHLRWLSGSQPPPGVTTRLHETALAVSLQVFVNTGTIDPVLDPYMPEIGKRALGMRDWIARRRLEAIRARFAAAGLTPDALAVRQAALADTLTTMIASQTGIAA